MQPIQDKIRYVFANINVLNLFLMASLLCFAGSTVLPGLDMRMTSPLQIKKTPIGSTEEKISEEVTPPSPADYILLAEENLFHPERRIPPEKKADEQPLPQPEFVLYGTLISDALNLAYMEDLKAPRNTPGRGKRQVALRKGDFLSGYTVKEIQHDKVMMARGEQQLNVFVLDQNRPKTREMPIGSEGPGESRKAISQRPGSGDRPVRKDAPTRNRARMSEAEENTRAFFNR